MTLPLGTRIAEFEINEVLGEGGFGVVYLATDRQLGRQVALKEYMPVSLAVRRPDHSVGPRSTDSREAFELGLRSFINEARLLAQFEHPSLARIHRFWEEHGTAYIVMPFYQGVTLKSHLKQHPRPSEAWLRHMLEPLMDALAMLHARHCYHRDIAPDNILLLPDGRPLLLDFGAARQVVGQATHSLTAILKPGYAPIEQYGDSLHAKQGPWTDIYALSAVLYCAMVGKPPPASVARILDDELEPAGLLVGSRYSTGLLEAVDAGLRLMPETRPQSIAEFAALLNRSMAPPDDDRTIPPPAARSKPQATPADDTPVSGVRVTSALGAQQSEFSWWPPAAAPTAVPRRGPVVAAAGAGLAVLAVAAAALWWLLNQPEEVGPEAGPVSPPASAVQELPASPPEAVVERETPAAPEALPASTPAPREPATTRPAPARPSPGDTPTQATRPPRDKQLSADEAACASLLQRASMGEDTPALREQLKTLNCR